MTLSKSRRRAPTHSGFSLIELMVAMVVLLVGLISTAGLVLAGVAASLQAKDLAVANQLAKDAMESVFMARITGRIPFSAVNNKSQPDGIFNDGYQPINAPSPDGLVNTDLYLAQPPLSYDTPSGRVTFDRFQRQILIEGETVTGDPNLRQVTINVRFTFKGLTSVASVRTVMSPIN